MIESVPFFVQVACVESFINSVDSQMQQRQEQQKLAAISARLVPSLPLFVVQYFISL